MLQWTIYRVKGKENFLKTIKDAGKDGVNYLAIVDGAASGSETEEVIQYMNYRDPSVEVYAPESFEYLILSSGLLNITGISDKLEHTSDYADSSWYMSWEQFYTALLIELTDRTQMKYDKRKLNMYYMSDKNKRMILDQLPEVLKKYE